MILSRPIMVVSFLALTLGLTRGAAWFNPSAWWPEQDGPSEPESDWWIQEGMERRKAVEIDLAADFYYIVLSEDIEDVEVGEELTKGNNWGNHGYHTLKKSSASLWRVKENTSGNIYYEHRHKKNRGGKKVTRIANDMPDDAPPNVECLKNEELYFLTSDNFKKWPANWLDAFPGSKGKNCEDARDYIRKRLNELWIDKVDDLRKLKKYKLDGKTVQVIRLGEHDRRRRRLASSSGSLSLDTQVAALRDSGRRRRQQQSAK